MGIVVQTRNGWVVQQPSSTRTAPQYLLDASLGGRLRLLGYDSDAQGVLSRHRYRSPTTGKVLPGYREPFRLQHAAQPESVEELTTDYA